MWCAAPSGISRNHSVRPSPRYVAPKKWSIARKKADVIRFFLIREEWGTGGTGWANQENDLMIIRWKTTALWAEQIEKSEPNAQMCVGVRHTYMQMFRTTTTATWPSLAQKSLVYGRKIKIKTKGNRIWRGCWWRACCSEGCSRSRVLNSLIVGDSSPLGDVNEG